MHSLKVDDATKYWGKTILCSSTLKSNGTVLPTPHCSYGVGTYEKRSVCTFYFGYLCNIVKCYPRIYLGLIDSAVGEWHLQACISIQAEHFEHGQFGRLVIKCLPICLSHVDVKVLKLRTL